MNSKPVQIIVIVVLVLAIVGVSVFGIKTLTSKSSAKQTASISPVATAQPTKPLITPTPMATPTLGVMNDTQLDAKMNEIDTNLKNLTTQQTTIDSLKASDDTVPQL
jgi:hypothetical protein